MPSSKTTKKSISHRHTSKRTYKPKSNRGRRVKKKRYGRKNTSLFFRLWHLLPGWWWWVGGAMMVVFFVWALKDIFSRKVDEIVFPSGYHVHGIDVSHHQGNVDWELVRNRGSINDEPVSFVFMKATEGTTFVDSKYRQNFSATKRYGFMRGAYHFYRPSLSAKAQADFYISQVQLEQGDLPPILDIEVRPSAGQSANEFRHDILTWLECVEHHYGVKPILYTYHSFHQQYLRDSVFQQYPYWIAHYYVDSVRYNGPWHFWQHTDRGQLPGIKGNVDFNVFNGTYDELKALAIGQGKEVR